MKILLRSFVLLALVTLSRAETIIEATVTGIPADATEVVFILDMVAPAEPADYDDPNQAAAPVATLPVLIPPAAGQPPAPNPAATAPPRRRRNNAAKAAPAIRNAMKTGAGTSLTWRTPTPAGENYRVRVVALKGGGTFPLVIAGGKVTGLKVEADQVTGAAVNLSPPAWRFAPQNPSAVAPGAKFTLAGSVSDPAGFLGTKNRMRVWWTTGQPPTENRAGTQVSTVDVTTKGGDVTFAVELTAPREAGPLYVQFGELSNDFNRPDGKQVPFLVFPDVAAQGAPLKVLVGPVASRQ